MRVTLVQWTSEEIISRDIQVKVKSLPLSLSLSLSLLGIFFREMKK